MASTYRIVLKDTFNNESFKFACFYNARNSKVASILAINEWGKGIVIDNIMRRVEGGYTQHL